MTINLFWVYASIFVTVGVTVAHLVLYVLHTRKGPVSEHPSLRAMFAALPDENMSTKQKARWLRSMKSLLDVVYPDV